MALFVCRKCGESYSSSLDSCPHCGYSPKYYSCPECGNPYTTADTDCSKCGIRLEGVQRTLADDESVHACYEQYKSSLEKARTAAGWMGLAHFFSGLEGYEDSRSLFEFCQKKAAAIQVQERQDSICRHARELVDGTPTVGELEACINDLKSIPECEDSKPLLTDCIESLKARRYEDAVKREESNPDSDTLRELMKLYASMPGYRDSSQRFEACSRKLRRASAKKRNRILFPAIGAVVLLLLIAAFIWRGPIIYRFATEAFEKGSYERSVKLFGMIKNYEDAGSMMEESLRAAAYSDGDTAFSAGDYKLAIEKFREADTFRDAAERMYESELNDYYSEGVAAFERQDYTAAIEYFTNAGSLGDAEERRRESVYSRGLVYLTEGKFDEAIGEFGTVLDHSDARELQRKAYYLMGTAQQKEGQIDKAITSFGNCLGYEDTDDILLHIGEKDIEAKNYKRAESALKKLTANEAKQKCSYAAGMGHLQAGEYDEAIRSLGVCRGEGAVYDSEEKFLEANYLNGKALFSKKDYSTASRYFRTAGAYSDAKDMLTACDFMIAEMAYSEGKLNTAKAAYEKLPSDFSYNGVSVSDRISTLSKYSRFVDLCGEWSVSNSNMETYQYWNYDWSWKNWYRDSSDRSRLKIYCTIKDNGKVFISGSFSMTHYTNYSSLSANLKTKTDSVTFSKEISSMPYDLEIRSYYTLTYSGGQFTVNYYKKDNSTSANFTYIYKTKIVYGTREVKY